MPGSSSKPAVSEEIRDLAAGTEIIVPTWLDRAVRDVLVIRPREPDPWGLLHSLSGPPQPRRPVPHPGLSPQRTADPGPLFGEYWT
jgi:hypothetical protein